MNRREIAEWHNAAKFPINDEVLANRCKALNAILSENDYSYWIDIVKLFLGLEPNPKTESSFVKELQDNDETFPRIKKLEKQVVVQAAIALSCKIQMGIDFLSGIKPSPAKVVTPVAVANGEESEEEGVEEDAQPSEEDIEIARLICSAIENASFQKHIKIETKIGLIEKIREFRSKFKSTDRDVEDHDDLLSEIETRHSGEDGALNTADLLNFTKALRSQIRTNDILSEELNILWWLFGEYSEVANDYFGNIHPNALALIIAREIHDLSSFNTEIPAARHLIRKALSTGRNSGENAVATIKTCFDALSIEQKKKIIENYEADICELTPCLNALKSGKDFTRGKDPKTKAEDNISLDTLAMQVYRELNFLSAI